MCMHMSTLAARCRVRPGYHGATWPYQRTSAVVICCHLMGRDQTRMLICAVASLVLVVAGTLVMDWYRLTLETADGLTRAIIDLRSVRACSPGHPCATQSLTRMAGMFPTLAAVTLWSSLGFAALVTLQAGARVLTGGAYEVFTKLGYMLALMAISLAVATAYMFGPDSHGVAAALAARPGVDLHRTWAPLALIVGLSLGFIVIYLAVSRESSDLGAAYKPVTIPSRASPEANERPASNRAPTSARPRTGPARIDPSAGTRSESPGQTRSARGGTAAEPLRATPKASTSGAMTAVERRDPAGVLRLARESAALRRREPAAGASGRSASAAERRDQAGRPTTRDASAGEPRDAGRRSEHSAAARLDHGAAQGTPSGLAGARERLATSPSALRPARDLQPPDARGTAGSPRRHEQSVLERLEPSSAHRRDQPGAAEPRDASGILPLAGRTTRDLRSPERREPNATDRRELMAAVERREPSGTYRRDDAGAAERREPSGTYRRNEASVAERLEQSGAGPHRVTREFRSVERRESSSSDLRSEPGASEPRERTGTGVLRAARELNPAERLEQSGTHRRGDFSAVESTVRTAREINSAEHRDYTGVRPGELASTEPREATGVHREQTGALRAAERAGGEAREATGTQRNSGVQIGVLRVRTQPSAPRAASDASEAPEPPEHTGMTRASGDDAAAPREQTGVGRSPRGTASAIPREQTGPGLPIGSTPIGILRAAPDASGVREPTGVLRAARGTTSAAEREQTGVGRSPGAAADTAGASRARPALPVPPDHLRNRLSYVALTAELTGGGIDARREDGVARLVLWRDIVGVVARRMPPDAGGAAFVDIVSTAGSTLRIVPWTRLSGEPIAADGDHRPRAVVEHIVARCPSVRLDPATQQFLDTGEPAQLPDLETLRAHDSRLA